MANSTPKMNMFATTTGAMAMVAGSMGFPRKDIAEAPSQWCTLLRCRGGGEDFEAGEGGEKLVHRGNQ